jgi:hypothetical protein
MRVDLGVLFAHTGRYAVDWFRNSSYANSTYPHPVFLLNFSGEPLATDPQAAKN